MSDQNQLVVETPTGWMIRCRCRGEGSWHEFPKQGRPGASWTFNGNTVKPTFTPSMNECLNPSNSEDFNPDAHLVDFRCHFIITDGMIHYCGDCSHELRGTTHPMVPWEEKMVRYHRLRMEEFNSGTAAW